MKNFILIVSFILVCSFALAHIHSPGMGTKPVTLVPGMGNHHHPVSTASSLAQRYFDQALTYVFAFNHDEAVRCFKKAAELDPNLAMAHWGIALALGPNINLDVDPDREKAAYEEIQKASAMASKAQHNERDYIEALAKRYSNDPKADLKKLAVDYKDAMGELVKKYPDDVDLATLYAESMMDLRPWQLWSNDGKPAEGTEEIIAVLESVLKRDPNHPGANHYYIHTVEASPHPERALICAKRLETAVPAAGHLVHMPAHIYIRTGDYAGASRQNAVAAAADRVYFQRSGVQGFYTMYYAHNVHFLSAAAAMEGRYVQAKTAAYQVFHLASDFVKQMPMVEAFLPWPTFTLVRFQKWNEIQKLPAPPADQKYVTAAWHFARGVAFAATGKAENAETEQKAFREVMQAISPDMPTAQLNPVGTVLAIAGNVLDARIALAKQDKKTAIELYRKAVEQQDALNYDEPPDWFYPVRESLGGALLLNGQADEAEKVFRDDLARNPRNGRSLFGLMEALKAQGKEADAGWVEQQFRAAWKNADTQLRVADL